MARITKNEAKEIARLQKSAKAKVARLKKKGLSDEQIPRIPQIDTSMSRAEVNEIKSNLASFINRSNQRWQFIETDTGAFIPKTVANKIQREQKRVNKLITDATERNANKPYVVKSEQGRLGTARTVKTDGMLEAPRLYTREITSLKSMAEARNYMQRLEGFTSDWLDKHDVQWRENTIKALRTVYSPEEIEELVDSINALSLPDFVKAMETQDISIAYIYTDADRENEIQRLLSYFDQENINML